MTWGLMTAIFVSAAIVMLAAFWPMKDVNGDFAEMEIALGYMVRAGAAVIALLVVWLVYFAGRSMGLLP